MQHLLPNTTLQGGKYRIERVLKQGCFGIKRIVIILLFVLLPSLLMAQAAGGTIKRTTGGNTKTKGTIVKNKDREVISSKTEKYDWTAPSLTQVQKEKIIQNIISNMIYVEGGTFMMGDPSVKDPDKYVNQLLHKVNVQSFYIGKYEVTQEEWYTIMGYNPSKYKGDKRPVEQVELKDCEEFISRLNNITGRNFRLPKEEEWEYAARGGKFTRQYEFAGSNNANSVAWHGENSGSGLGHTHLVGKKNPNELGLYDMSGNVAELTQGVYVFRTTGNSGHVYRGGSYLVGPHHCYVYDREPSSVNGSNQGLRIVMDVR